MSAPTATRTAAQASAERVRYGSRGRPAAQPAAPRKNGLAQIHIAKAQLGLDDDTYRAMLWAVARVKSAKDLDHAGRTKVLEHLKKSGFKPQRPKTPHPGTPHNMAQPQRADLLKKIEALLTEAARPWAYADGVAYRMFGIQKLTFCHEGHLHKIVAALVYDQQRRDPKGGA